MLAQALVAVVDHLEDAAWLTSTLGGLGAKHVGYGVTAEMYDWVGDSLLRTLAEVAGGDWTPEHQGAWAEAQWRHRLADARRRSAGHRLISEHKRAAPEPSRARARTRYGKLLLCRDLLGCRERPGAIPEHDRSTTDPAEAIERVEILVQHDLEAGGVALLRDDRRPGEEQVPDAEPALAVLLDRIVAALLLDSQLSCQRLMVQL